MSTALKLSLITIPAALLFAMYFLCTTSVMHDQHYFLIAFS